MRPPSNSVGLCRGRIAAPRRRRREARAAETWSAQPHGIRIASSQSRMSLEAPSPVRLPQHAAWVPAPSQLTIASSSLGVEKSERSRELVIHRKFTYHCSVLHITRCWPGSWWRVHRCLQGCALLCSSLLYPAPLEGSKPCTKMVIPGGFRHSSSSSSTLASALKWNGRSRRFSSDERQETRWKGLFRWAAFAQCENRQMNLQVLDIERNGSCWIDRDQKSSSKMAKLRYRNETVIHDQAR